MADSALVEQWNRRDRRDGGTVDDLAAVHAESLADGPLTNHVTTYTERDNTIHFDERCWNATNVSAARHDHTYATVDVDRLCVYCWNDLAGQALDPAVAAHLHARATVARLRMWTATYSGLTEPRWVDVSIVDAAIDRVEQLPERHLDPAATAIEQARTALETNPTHETGVELGERRAAQRMRSSLGRTINAVSERIDHNRSGDWVSAVTSWVDTAAADNRAAANAALDATGIDFDTRADIHSTLNALMTADVNASSEPTVLVIDDSDLGEGPGSARSELGPWLTHRVQHGTSTAVIGPGEIIRAARRSNRNTAMSTAEAGDEQCLDIVLALLDNETPPSDADLAAALDVARDVQRTSVAGTVHSPA